MPTFNLEELSKPLMNSVALVQCWVALGELVDGELVCPAEQNVQWLWGLRNVLKWVHNSWCIFSSSCNYLACQWNWSIVSLVVVGAAFCLCVSWLFGSVIWWGSEALGVLEKNCRISIHGYVCFPACPPHDSGQAPLLLCRMGTAILRISFACRND